MPSASRASRRDLLALLPAGAVSAGLFVGIACSSLRPVRVIPVPDEASRLFGEADALDAVAARGERAIRDRERARALAEQALAAAADWVAPRRLLDDLARTELCGVEALQAHLDRLAASGEDARELYLAGRLEGQDGEPRFARAAELDPMFAWARHGLATSADRRGDARLAVAHARAALARARDPFERSFFSSSLARLLARSSRGEEALAVLAARLADPDVAPHDRIQLSAQSAEVALDEPDEEEMPAARRRALELIRDPEIPDPEVESLAGKLRSRMGSDESTELELSRALASRRSPVRDRLRAELMLDAGPSPLALGLLERSLAEEFRPRPAGPLLRAARFAAGECAPAVEGWLADLPSRVLGPDGLPRDERLAKIVRCERAVAGSAPGEGPAEGWFELGEALLDGGWFREARALAGPLARADFERALSLESRGAEGMQLLDALGELLRGAGGTSRIRLGGDRDPRESGERSSAAGRARPAPPTARDLDGLLGAMEPLFARSAGLLGGDRDLASIAREIRASPLLDYGVAGSVVHPGPRFTGRDQREGLGKAGEPVPGLARAMDAIQRFALLGELSGAGGPDGTVLPRLMVEDRSGEHLGVPWSGSVVWCESADVRSRAEREGARISAAALHEGYWVDIDSVRGERTLFAALRTQFSGPDAAARVERALAVTGFTVDAGSAPEERRRRRTRTGSALDESSRVRLAILRDRAAGAEDPGGALGDVGLDELVHLTGTHEEGHLTDRTRFLPLSRHWGRVMAFLLECGFSPRKVIERLEYRAELVALVDAQDPRVALAQVLDAAESGGRGPTAHAAGYAELLADLLLVLDEAIEDEPGSFPGIDTGRTLLQQLHRLTPDEVRRLARRLAVKDGLVR